MSENDLYAYWPISERPPVYWPGEKTLAFYIGLNIEHYELEPPDNPKRACVPTFCEDWP